MKFRPSPTRAETRAGIGPTRRTYDEEQDADGSAMTDGFQTVLAASERERRDLFPAAANRLGTAQQNIEKDFWVCWTLDALFNGVETGGPAIARQGRNIAFQRLRPDRAFLRRYRHHRFPRGHLPTGNRRGTGSAERQEACSPPRRHPDLRPTRPK